MTFNDLLAIYSMVGKISFYLLHLHSPQDRRPIVMALFDNQLLQSPLHHAIRRPLQGKRQPSLA